MCNMERWKDLLTFLVCVQCWKGKGQDFLERVLDGRAVFGSVEWKGSGEMVRFGWLTEGGMAFLVMEFNYSNQECVSRFLTLPF